VGKRLTTVSSLIHDKCYLDLKSKCCIGCFEHRLGKRVVRFGFGSGLCSVRVNFGLSPFGLGTGLDRVKFGFGSISDQSCSGRLKSGSGLFEWCYGNPVQVGYGLGLLWVG